LKYFSIGTIGKKLLGSFSDALAIRGEIGLCCKVRPMKQVGTAAPITSWTAFQNESTSFAACRCSSGFSNVGSTVDSGLAVALDRRFIPHACLRKPQLFIATRKQIDWAGILPRTKHEERKNTT
jgi:hypothetical protein